MNHIIIQGLTLESRIGVPEEERAVTQRLTANISIEVQRPFGAMADELEATIDYDTAAQRVRELALERPRLLIETLADEIATALVEEFGARRAEVEVRKFILEGTEYVAARCSCEAE